MSHLWRFMEKVDISDDPRGARQCMECRRVARRLSYRKGTSC